METVKSLQQIEKTSTAIYFYDTAEGEKNYLKCRYKKSGEEIKGCYYALIDPVKNLWQMGLNGHSHILYRLPELIQAKKTGRRIFIGEGEKDVETLRAQGEIATTSGGWQSWKPEFAEYFRGYTGEVIVIPDQDEPGQKYGETVFNSLASIVPMIYIVNVTKGKDITDFLQEKTMIDLEELISIARASRINQIEIDNMTEDFCQKTEKPLPVGPAGAGAQEAGQNNWKPLEDISLKDFIEKKYEPIKWLVEDILPEGVSILAGDPKVGKTYFALNIALSIATGEKALGHLQTEKMGVAYFGIDERDRYLQLKLHNIMEFQQRNNIPDNFKFIFEMNRLTEGGYEQLSDYLDRNPDVKFIVIDTLAKFRKPSMRGNAYELDVESIGKIYDISKKKNVSILLLHHNKKGKSNDFLSDLSGSMGISGSVDTILGLARTNFENEGTLKVKPRIGEEKDLSVKFNKELFCWELLGDSEVYSQSKERREIIDILFKENSPMSNKDLQGLLNKNYNAIRYLTWKMEKENILIKIGKNSYMISPYYNMNKSTNTTNSTCSTNSTCTTNSTCSTNTASILTITASTASTGILGTSSKNTIDSKEKNTTASTASTVSTIEKKVKCSNCVNFIGKNKTAFFPCEFTGKSIYPMAEHPCNSFNLVELSEDFNREELPF